MAVKQWIHPHPCARTHNLKKRQPRPARATTGGDHRGCRARQVLARLSTRSTPRANGATSNLLSAYARQFWQLMEKTRRRPHRGPLPGDLHRAEGHQPQPAFDRRHGHRDSRLPAPPVRPCRRSAMPGTRHPRWLRRRCRRWSMRFWRCGRHPADDPAPLVVGRKGENLELFSSCARRASCGFASTARCTRSTPYQAG